MITKCWSIAKYDDESEDPPQYHVEQVVDSLVPGQPGVLHGVGVWIDVDCALPCGVNADAEQDAVKIKAVRRQSTKPSDCAVARIFY